MASVFTQVHPYPGRYYDKHTIDENINHNSSSSTIDEKEHAYA